jgi:hypothetical protein
MNTIPQELNWVERRGACTASKVFEQLIKGIENDVATINKMRGLNEQRFTAELLSDGSTLVVGQINIEQRRRVKVGISQSKIVALEEGISRKTVTASIGLNNEGRCILKLEDEAKTELEQWQFRKIVLEGLLFGD